MKNKFYTLMWKLLRPFVLLLHPCGNLADGVGNMLDGVLSRDTFKIGHSAISLSRAKYSAMTDCHVSFAATLQSIASSYSATSASSA